MISCPICFSAYEKKNDGKGIYHQCVNCNSRVYSFSLLKRLDFRQQLFTNLLISAKKNQTKFSGSCISCGQPYHKESYETSDYRTTIYVCPTCLLFGIKQIDLPLFENKTKKSEQPEKELSSEAKQLLEEMDEKLLDNQDSWQSFDKVFKVSKSKTIGFSAYLIGLVIGLVKLYFAYFAATTISSIIFILFFILNLLGGFYFVLGKENIKKALKKYFKHL
ncbi:hypothetical protein ACFLYJ_00335 [Candidatus Cloacimonadota bacterium]